MATLRSVSRLVKPFTQPRSSIFPSLSMASRPLDRKQSIRAIYSSYTPPENDGSLLSSFSTNTRQTNMYRLGVTNGSIKATRTVPVSRRKRMPDRYSATPKLRGQLFPVSAVHAAQTINLAPLHNTLFGQNVVKKQSFGKNSVIVQLAPTNPMERPRFIAVFRFGSIVGVNMSPRELLYYVTEIKKYTVEPTLSGFERKENFSIVLREGDDYFEEDGSEPKVVSGESCVVQEIDMNNVAIISNIMAQTVALDTYSDVVDDLLQKFEEINTTVAKNGQFKPSDKSFLFKTVAQNNSIFIDMISKIRIKDRSDTAWTLVKYEKIHYGMKEEFEIDDRFDHIEFKLNLIQQNAKFFLEVLQHQKSNTLEYVIVWLIAVECVIMVTDMSGLGPVVFERLATIFSG